MKLVYLVGLHNSGSTVISLVANAHPEIVSPGEMVGPGGRFHGDQGPICSCGEVVAACPFWLDVGRRHRAQGHPFEPSDWGLYYRRPGLLGRLAFGRPGPRAVRTRAFRWLPPLGGFVRALDRRNVDFTRWLLEVSGKSVVLDASKDADRLTQLRRLPGLDVRVVHLIRDPRGWCNSRRKKQESSDRTAPHWSRENARIERIVEAFPAARRMQLRYEDFCRDPQEALDRICELADLAPSPIPDDLRTISHHLLGNRMRKRRDPRIELDLSWQSGLEPQEIELIEQVTAPVAHRYGYEFHAR